jgi:hypothetical protein
MIQSKIDIKEYQTNYSLASLKKPIINMHSDNMREMSPTFY